MNNHTNGVRTSICIDCKKSTGLCSWSKKFKPVEGWEAKEVKRSSWGYPQGFVGYKVIRCPEFEREDRDKDCSNCRYVMLCSIDKQAFYKNTGEQCTEYKEYDK